MTIKPPKIFIEASTTAKNPITFEKLISTATNLGVSGNFIQHTDYINTIPIENNAMSVGSNLLMKILLIVPISGDQ